MSLAATVSRTCLRCRTPITCLPAASFASSSFRSSKPDAEQVSTKRLTNKKEVLSSCPPGKTMAGLNILKDQSDPVSKPDDEYPAWVWTLLDGTKSSDLASTPQQQVERGEEVDWMREKKRLRAINKVSIKAKNFLKTT